MSKSIAITVVGISLFGVGGWHTQWLPIAMFCFLTLPEHMRMEEDPRWHKVAARRAFLATVIGSFSIIIFAMQTHPRSKISMSYDKGIISSTAYVRNESAVAFTDVSARLRLIDEEGKFVDTFVTWTSFEPNETKTVSLSPTFPIKRVEFLAENSSARGYFFDTDLAATSD